MDPVRKGILTMVTMLRHEMQRCMHPVRIMASTIIRRSRTMKQGIHPDYKLSEVHCACGEAYQTRSTKESIRLDICSVCHPFFTGKQKLIDTEGRIDKFRKKYTKA
jgi:large subunit ribosomal protein L31